MTLLFTITFQSGDFFYEDSNVPSHLAILISIVAAFIAFIGVRSQIISLIKNQLADKARECNKNINAETHRIIETPQNISHVVSTIITGKLLLDRVIKNSRVFFLFGLGKQSLIDQFYFQLHTSIIEYIIANTITPTFEEGQVKEHIKFQLNYCNKLFGESIKNYGNATPKEIQDQLTKYKESRKK